MLGVVTGAGGLAGFVLGTGTGFVEGIVIIAGAELFGDTVTVTGVDGKTTSC